MRWRMQARGLRHVGKPGENGMPGFTRGWVHRSVAMPARQATAPSENGRSHQLEEVATEDSLFLCELMPGNARTERNERLSRTVGLEYCHS